MSWYSGYKIVNTFLTYLFEAAAFAYWSWIISLWLALNDFLDRAEDCRILCPSSEGARSLADFFLTNNRELRAFGGIDYFIYVILGSDMGPDLRIMGRSLFK